MSLFERIQHRLNEVKITGDSGNPLEDKSEVDKLQKYKDDLAKKKGYVLNPTEKKKGMRLGDKLEKDIDLGARLQDKTGKRTPKQAYAQGMPFQADDNPDTIFKKSNIKGRYPTSGKRILDKRYQYQIDLKKSPEEAVKSRLKTRLGYVNDPKLKDRGDINKLVNKVAKGQKINTAKGKDSSLFKTLKKYTAATEPTVKGKYGKPARMVRGKDGVLRQYGGGQVPMPSGKKRDDLIKKNLKKFDDDLVKGANIPKGTYIPKGGTPAMSDIKTGKVTYQTPFEPKEFNLQYKYDKLEQDYGGRIANRDPKISGMTAAQKKANYEKIKARIDKKNPTFKSPLTGGRLPVTPENMKKYKVNKQGFTKGQVFKKFASKQAGKGFNLIKGAAARNPLIAGAIALGAGAYVINKARKALGPKTLDMEKDFTKTAPIKYGSASKASDRPKGKNIGDTVRFQYARSSDRKVKDKAGPYLKKDQLDKFKSGKYTVSTKSGQKINVADRLKNSAFAQQVKKARQSNKKKDQAFLKSVKNSSVVKGL